MRGIVYTGDGVEVTDALDVRSPGPNEVSVRIAAAGVCHSDLSVIDGTIPFPAPTVMGHEGAGVVEAVGSEVRSVKPGDHVVIATLASCGACRACSTGHPSWCKSTLGNISTPFTFKGEPASNFAATSVFVETTVVSEIQAVRIPKEVPLTSACLIGCGVLTGVGSVLNRARPAIQMAASAAKGGAKAAQYRRQRPSTNADGRRQPPKRGLNALERSQARGRHAACERPMQASCQPRACFASLENQSLRAVAPSRAR